MALRKSFVSVRDKAFFPDDPSSFFPTCVIFRSRGFRLSQSACRVLAILTNDLAIAARTLGMAWARVEGGGRKKKGGWAQVR
jgi:hypothetical protein